MWRASGFLVVGASSGVGAAATMNPEDVADTILHTIGAAGHIDYLAIIEHR